MESKNDSQANRVIAATVIGLFFAFTAVLLRYIARRYQGMRQFTEDWLIYAALVCKLAIDIGGIIRKPSAVNHLTDTLTM